MTYVEQTLATNEKIIYKAKITNWIWFWPLVWVVPTAPFIIIVGLSSLFIKDSAAMGWASLMMLVADSVVLLVPYLVQKTTELALTDRRVIAKFGLISRHTIEQRMSKIESVRIRQGIFGRLFKYGTIMVHGTGGAFTPITMVTDPLSFKRALEQLIDVAEAAEKH
jgi:uncharacterized membrane protein YdbT with pleckstrin-like domain